MRTSPTVSRSLAVLILVAAAILFVPRTTAADPAAPAKLGPLAQKRATRGTGWSSVIVRGMDGAPMTQLDALIQQAGGHPGPPLPIINARLAWLPDAALAGLANNPLIDRISLNRGIVAAMQRTNTVVGASAVRQDLGYDGAGIGVAVIDSGITPAHDDLAGADGNQRVARFVDFVAGHESAYDDYGHGTHVAGVVAGNGSDSGGARSGIAPAAHLIVLKVLDGTGTGRISDVIAALDYVVAHKDALNIRVVNLSVASGVYESYDSDPLTLAVKRAVMEGLVVVTAAGNAGRDQVGVSQYGGITAPANAPWVITVGAVNHMGSVDRTDDIVAPFSSRGPTAIDYVAKPDLAAPGVGIESLSAPESAFYTTLSSYLLAGTMPTVHLPYLSLSGTSMSAPVVTGTVALMLQANPALTPNAVKAILQYTSHRYTGYDELTQGAGLVNAKGAVKLARFFTGQSRTGYPWSSEWSKRIIWGNQLITGGRPTPTANAWSSDVTWGAATTPAGEDVAWGEICPGDECDADAILWDPWMASCSDEACSSITWGAGSASNVVWGSACGGADCPGPWSTDTAGAAILADSQATTVVWGSSDGDTVVWGSTVVWGAACTDPACQPVIWDKP